MQSWNQNKHSYHPDFWELEYVSYRYLSGLSNEALLDRYRSIIMNMRAYTDRKRDLIPLNSYQSSWYWFRKEHQTRLEFALRNIKSPALPRELQLTTGMGPSHPSVPNGTEVIFRYGKRDYMQPMVEYGRIRVSPAQMYKSDENNTARKDDEMRKDTYLPRLYTRIVQKDGDEINVIGDVKRTVGGPQYHLVCLSCVWDTQLFDEFEADVCVEITNPKEFTRRMELGGQSVFQDWYFYDNPVIYFDPYETPDNRHIIPGGSKDFRLAYQSEYRYLWSNIEGDEVQGIQFVNIGPSQDIMTMYDVQGRAIRV